MPQVLSDGTVVGGRYVLEARIGDGGMGTVYRARHAKVSRQFAIKTHRDFKPENVIVEQSRGGREIAPTASTSSRLACSATRC